VRFPVYIGRIHPHLLFEALGYAVAFGLLLWLRSKRGDTVEGAMRWTVIAAAFVGGALGSKILYWAEDPAATAAHWREFTYLMGGKTIVGGLVGGWVGVELMKRYVGIGEKTGDLLAVPIAVGIAIGRIGCFLTGLSDKTYGTPTSLPWGVDFGDGIRRHPVQLYEAVFLVGLAAAFYRLLPVRDAACRVSTSQIVGRRLRCGDLFKLFMVAYMSLRLVLDFWKPSDPAVFLGMGALQWACLAVLLVYWRDILRWFSPARIPEPAFPEVS
jgi:phosphatidylglycerol:prolipoprotein diacylglycerol transferase